MVDRVVVITGASSGIGAALAERLGREDTALVLIARREAELRAVAARSGSQAHTIVADVSERSQVREAVAGALAHFGRVDVWVNNAGRGITRAPSELTDEDIDDMMRLNVKSVLYCIQEILPHFRARGAGHVINISSMLGRSPLAIHRSAYNGAKHFLNALTANLRTEVQAQYPGIQFSLVSPGVVYTEFGRNALHGGPLSSQLPDGQDPEAVAQVIADVIESRRPDVYTRPGSRDRIVGYFAGLGEDP